MSFRGLRNRLQAKPQRAGFESFTSAEPSMAETFLWILIFSIKNWG